MKSPLPWNLLVPSQFLPLAMGWRARTILRQNQIVPGDGEEEEGGPADGVVQINWRRMRMRSARYKRRRSREKGKCWWRVKMTWTRSRKGRICVVEEDAEQRQSRVQRGTRPVFGYSWAAEGLKQTPKKFLNYILCLGQQALFYYPV